MTQLHKRQKLNHKGYYDRSVTVDMKWWNGDQVETVQIVFVQRKLKNMHSHTKTHIKKR